MLIHDVSGTKLNLVGENVTGLGIYSTCSALLYKPNFYSGVVECLIVMQVAQVQFPTRPDMIIFSSSVTFFTQCKIALSPVQ